MGHLARKAYKISPQYSMPWSGVQPQKPSNNGWHHWIDCGLIRPHKNPSVCQSGKETAAHSERKSSYELSPTHAAPNHASIGLLIRLVIAGPR